MLFKILQSINSMGPNAHWNDLKIYIYIRKHENVTK